MTGSFDIDQRGVVVPAEVTSTVDVLFDGQRVWSFHPERDGTAVGPHRAVGWPKVLRPHLDGKAHVELVDHVLGTTLHDARVAFGDSPEPVRVVDAEGHPLAVDKGGRLQRDFSNTDTSAREEVLDALEQVLHDLRDACGLDAYLMYGCLLGAVRDGHMIGHDSDADVAYLSRHHHPFDVIHECSTAIRAMRGRGWKITRMSGANFKVWVPLPDGRRVGIDVFGSFHILGRFHVTGSLTGTLDRSALVPFGTVTLEGRELVAPAKPEEVLEFTYGPGWRIPDPAFHFEHDPADVTRMTQWFRASRRRLRFWEDFYKGPDAKRVPAEPSRFARWVQQRWEQRPEPVDRVLDVGAGTGRDARYFAAQGHHTVALEYVPLVLRAPEPPPASSPGGDVAPGKVVKRLLNLEDLRSVLVTGTRYAHQRGTREVYARGLLDTLSATGRDNFWRFASMVQRRGGETYAEFRTPRSRGEPMHFGPHGRTFVEPDVAVREVEQHGGRVLHRETGRGLAPLGEEDPEVCRLVVRWDR